MNLKEKFKGTIKSKLAWLSSIWIAIILNIDTIQTLLPQVKEYFGDDVSNIVNKVFFFLFIYVRVFHTTGSVEDKCKGKENVDDNKSN